MPASYSKDLRKKVIKYIESGNSCNSASIKFEIAVNTARNWYKRYKTEGHYLSRKVGGKKGRITREDVISYMELNPNFTLLAMGKHFNMSTVGAHYWLKKLGYSYNKKSSPMWKQMRKKEENTKKK